MSTQLAPVTSGERAAVIDQLRGFAIFGILVVNTFYFFHPFFAPALTDASTAADRAAHFLITFLFLGKFYTLFSFLFGLGLHIQMRRAEARGARVVPAYLRRLLVLAAMGLAHGVLLWIGDILLIYAATGLLLLWWFRNRSARTLKIWAIVFLAGLVLFFGVVVGSMQMARLAPPESGAWERVESIFAETAQGIDAAVARDYEVYGTGSYAAITRERWRDYTELLTMIGPWMLPSVLAMFLLGLRAGKRGWFDLPAAGTTMPAPPPPLPDTAFAPDRQGRCRRLLWQALPLGLALNLYVAATGFEQNRLGLEVFTWQTFLQVGALTIGSVLLALSWVALAILAANTARGRRALAPLGPVGRLALSNYLLQSLVMTTLAYGYGLGLFGQVGPAAGLLLACALFALQVPLSRWWLGRFRFGPAEWLWRTLTYLRRQPFRA